MTIKRGDSKEKFINFTDADGQPIDITDYIIRFTVREKSGVDLTDTEDDDDALIAIVVDEHIDAANGQTGFEITKEQTNLKPKTYFYDIQVTTPAGKVTTLEMPDGGEFVITADVTRTPE
jgi:hypothetical protein